MKRNRFPRLAAATLAALVQAVLAQPASTIVYRCPGNVFTSDRELSAKQANEQGCKVIEGTPITVIQSRPPAPRPSGDAQAAAVPRPGDTRVDPGAQRARDTDSRRILEAELRREEGRLADLKREYNNGEPERQGNERNYQKYLDRVADLQSGIARKEGDIAAIKRELAKLPP
ncbi:MAG: hypothetical protein U1E72_13855 [Burkholderiaceae bacterium]